MAIATINREYIIQHNIKEERVREIRCYNGVAGESILQHPDGDTPLKWNNSPARSVLSLSGEYKEGNAFYSQVQDKLETIIKICKKNGINSPHELAQLNISHYPAGAETLWDTIRIDITARIMSMVDKTPFLATQIINGEFTNPFDPQWLLKYVAPFKEIDGRGQNVPMVLIKTGGTTSIRFQIFGVGFQTDLYNEMFNNIFSMQKVNQAVAEGYILKKNDLVYSPIFSFSYPANKIVQAETAYATYEENMYYTWRAALRLIAKLTDFQSGSYIDASSNLSVISHSTRIADIVEMTDGLKLRGDDKVRSLRKLNEISRIIPYNTEYQYYNNESIEYTGCATTKAYLFVPNPYYWLAMKRDLTHNTGPGNTFAITGKQESWYFVPAVYNDLFMGGDTNDGATAVEPGTTITQLNGYIVEVNLPDEPDNPAT